MKLSLMTKKRHITRFLYEENVAINKIQMKEDKKNKTKAKWVWKTKEGWSLIKTGDKWKHRSFRGNTKQNGEMSVCMRANKVSRSISDKEETWRIFFSIMKRHRLSTSALCILAWKTFHWIVLLLLFKSAALLLTKYCVIF